MISTELCHTIYIDYISAVADMVGKLDFRFILTNSVVELIDYSALYPEELLYRFICKGKICFNKHILICNVAAGLTDSREYLCCYPTLELLGCGEFA